MPHQHDLCQRLVCTHVCACQEYLKLVILHVFYLTLSLCLFFCVQHSCNYRAPTLMELGTNMGLGTNMKRGTNIGLVAMANDMGECADGYGECADGYGECPDGYLRIWYPWRIRRSLMELRAIRTSSTLSYTNDLSLMKTLISLPAVARPLHRPSTHMTTTPNSSKCTRRMQRVRKWRMPR